jgi:C_GCAxxG_C_C family probable redox protein
MTRQETIDLAVKYFTEGHACSQSVLLAFADRIGLDKTIAKRISGTFGGGMGRLRSKCGALTGGFMVLGMVEGYEGPEQMEQKMAVYKRVRELNKKVEDQYGETNCNELLIKYSNPSNVTERKHHQDICVRLVADTTGYLYDMLEEYQNKKGV